MNRQVSRIRSALSALAIGLVTGSALAEERPGGDFDYYLLALSWNAAWCEQVGDHWENGEGAGQCDARHAHGWLLHGLWPQYARGWPENCRSNARNPSRRETAAMADIMGSGSSAWHQWKKHGRCAGLAPGDYFAKARQAYDSIARPELLRRVTDRLSLDPDVIEAAFLKANPGLGPEDIVVTCQRGLIREVRVCLGKDLRPRACGQEQAQSCRAPAAAFPPMR